MVTSRLLARAVWRQRRGPILLAILTLALVAGSSAGAIAAARRGSSALERLTTEFNLPAHTVFALDDSPASRRSTLQALFDAPDQISTRIAAVAALVVLPDVGTSFQVPGAGLLAEIEIRGGSAAEPVIVSGRRPVRSDEIALSEAALRGIGRSVGDQVRLAWFRSEDLEIIGGGGTTDPAGTRSMTITGVARSPFELVPDARAEEGTIFGNDRLAYLSAEFAEAAGDDVAAYGTVALLDSHAATPSLLDALAARDDVAVQEGMGDDLAALSAVDRSLQRESDAVMLLGIALAVVAGGIVLPALGRAVTPTTQDLRILDDLGMDGPDRRRAATTFGATVGAIAALGASVIAVGTSAWAPFGFASRVEIDRGADIDLLVLPAAAALIVVGSVATALLSTRSSLVRQPIGSSSAHGKRGVGPVATPVVPALTIRMASAATSGRGGGALRAAAAAVATVVVAVAALTFAESTRALLDSPDDQGWTWDLAVGNYNEPESAGAAEKLLDADPVVAGSVGLNGADFQVDGSTVPVAVFDGIEIQPQVRIGRAPERAGEIALGARTARDLDRRVGDVVELALEPGGSTIDAIVVGIVVPPATLLDSLTLDGGATITIETVRDSELSESPAAPSVEPFLHLVDLRAGTSLERGADHLAASFPGTVNTLRSPVDLRALARVRSVPIVLAALVVLTGVSAVVIALRQLWSRRRRDYAILRSLGMTRVQIAVLVSGQAALLSAVLVAAGAPLGVAAGRSLWTATAAQLGTDVDPVLPAASLSQGALLVVSLTVALALLSSIRSVRRSPAGDLGGR